MTIKTGAAKVIQRFQVVEAAEAAGQRQEEQVAVH
jgi:hypothetical protein